MSERLGFIKNPLNNVSIEVFKGYSWPNLFFGPFHFAYKGLWFWFIVSFLASLVTYSLSNIVFAFFANKLIVSHFVKTMGFIPDENVRKFLEIDKNVTIILND